MPCFERDNNVCTCAVSTLIPLPGVNISPKMDSATSIFYIRGNFSLSSLLLAYFADFSLRMCSFDHIITSCLKSNAIFEFSAHVFL